MPGALEELTATVAELKASVEAQTAEIQSLYEKVEPLKSFYTIRELWRLLGGPDLCTFASFQRSRDLPPPDGYFRKQRAYKRETVLAYMAKFTERRKK